ncbi:MAG: Penicillin-binding protein [Candidatus Collierbacteria bacterium GW2011_GWD2_45_10]|nr:MAG: Penicillin-binding protein [Candidatus Collierbacteria bacterium GW2011_GWD2_45_10]
MVAAVFLWYGRDLPDPTKVQRKSGFSSEILDRTGKVVLYDVYTDQDRKFTPLSEVPDYLKKATIAIEDKEFYKHQGFDPMSMFRIAKNLVINRRLIGGSTLTQQLVKMLLLTNERSVSRKVREFMLALRIEKTFTKDEILQMYLNEAPYGGNAVGVASASQIYFEKEPKELTLTESVLLAGLPQSPSRYSPYSGSNKKAYLPRAKEVSRRMREDGMITKEMETQVNSELDSIQFRGLGSNKIKAPHFVMYVKQLLEEKYGSSILDTGGLKVTTSLNWDIQQKAEMAVKEEVDKVSESLNIKNGASIIIDTNNGEILSMVGSKNFFDTAIDGEVNVTTRLRQPGSSIKPVVYATAFMKNFGPASVLSDVVTEFPGKDDKTPYVPKNYDGKEHGLLHLRDALASSINVPAVKLLALVGVENVLRQGYKMGLTSLEPTRETMARVGLSMALGGAEVRLLDLAGAYSAFSNGGYKIDPVVILKIEDGSGRMIFENKMVKPERVLDEKVAFLINSVLSDNNARLLTFGPNSYLNLGPRAVAVKTGTTNDLRDNWTIGWTKDFIVGVWVGNNNNEKMKNVASGVSGAAPIWRREVTDMLSIRSDQPFTPPDGVSEIEVDKISGYPAHDGFGSYKEWFINGSVPTGPDPIHTKVKLCKNDPTKLADPVSVSQGNYDEKEFVVIKENDPLTDKGLWQKAINEWITKQSNPIYVVPTETCGATSSMDIQIVTPASNGRVDGDETTIRFSVVSDKPIVEVKIFIDGIIERTITDGTYIQKIKMTTGQHSLRIAARNNEGKEESKTIDFAVNVDYVSPTPTSTPSPIP